MEQADSFSALCGSPVQFFFFVQPASSVWDILGIFHQTYVASILLYVLWLLHLMIVLNDVTFMVQRDSLQSTAYSGNCWGMMNSICLPGTDFCFKFSVLRVLGYHIYVDSLFMSFQWMKKFLLSYFCFCLISMVWFLVFWKIFRISFRLVFLLVHLPLSLPFLFFCLLTLTL